VDSSGAFKQAATTQARVIGALILREMRVRYGNSKLGYIWAILEPMAFVIAISTIFYFSGAHPPHGNNMGLFVALAIIPFFLYRNLANQLGAAFEANQALLNFPIVKEIDTVISRLLLEVATMIIIAFIVLSINIVLGGEALPNNFLKMLTAIIGISLLGFGIGLNNAVLASKFNSWRNIYGLLSTPLLWISGIFFSLESLPMNIRNILAWNPIIHGVESMRDGYYMNYRDSAIDLPYLFWVGLILTLIGLAGERAVRIRKS